MNPTTPTLQRVRAMAILTVALGLRPIRQKWGRCRIMVPPPTAELRVMHKESSSHSPHHDAALLHDSYLFLLSVYVDHVYTTLHIITINRSILPCVSVVELDALLHPQCVNAHQPSTPRYAHGYVDARERYRAM